MTEAMDLDHAEMNLATVTISDIVNELGNHGLVPYVICTGVCSQSVLSDALWKPRFGIAISSEREVHHIFTIASMAGWEAEFDLEGRGILVKRHLNGLDETIGAWALLLNATRLVMGEIRTH
jgi:hypothetical protein